MDEHTIEKKISGEYLYRNWIELKKQIGSLMNFAIDGSIFLGGYVSYITEKDEYFIFSSHWKQESILKEESLTRFRTDFTRNSFHITKHQLSNQTSIYEEDLDYGIVSIQFLPVEEGNIHFTLGIFEIQSDSSLNKQKRESLAVACANLLLLLGNNVMVNNYDEAGVSLKAALASAEEANLGKSRFLASMSHDLRTPLNTILGYSELLQDELADTMQESVLEDLKVINSAGHFLLSMINNLIDMANIEVGQMNTYPEPFNLRDSISEIKDYMEYHMHKTRNTLTIEMEENIRIMVSDSAKVRSCIFNLLVNANKFLTSGALNLKVTSSILNNEEWFHFEILVNGIVLEKEELENIFNPLMSTTNSHEKKYGGIGVGLPLVKRFSTMLGGDLRIESESNKGTTFFLLVPSGKISHPSIKEIINVEVNKSVRDSSKIVFIIDDDVSIRGLLSNYMSKEGYSVFASANGQDAISSIKLLKPFVITLDIRLPDIEGWELLKIIKADKDINYIPVIIITSMLDREKALSLKADQFMEKPIQKDSLLKIIREFYDQNINS